MQLHEQHRPRQWSDVCGQDKALAVIDRIRKRCGTVGGHAWFLSGASGTGKTTIARLLAAEVADSFAIDELSPSKLTADYLRTIDAKYAGRPLGGRGWAVIVNEVHALRKGQIEDLLTATEPEGGLPPWFIWCFTTTSDGAATMFEDYADAGPFASRCEVVTLEGTLEGLYRRLVVEPTGVSGNPLAHVKLRERGNRPPAVAVAKVFEESAA